MKTMFMRGAESLGRLRKLWEHRAKEFLGAALCSGDADFSRNLRGRPAAWRNCARRLNAWGLCLWPAAVWLVAGWGAEAWARSPGQIRVGGSTGNAFRVGSSGFGGRPGFCRPGYPLAGRNGIAVTIPVFAYGGWYDPWYGGYNGYGGYGGYGGYVGYGTPVYGWDPYAYSYAPPDVPSYVAPYAPGTAGQLPGSRATYSRAQRPPGPSFTPPPYTPLEKSLENSAGKSRERYWAPPPASPSPVPDRPENSAAKSGSLPKQGQPAGASVPSSGPSLRSGAVGYPSGPTPTGHPRTYRVQKALKELGYYEADVDGQLGRATQTAIRTYQIDRGLPVTGRIDPALEKELGLSPEL
jgi:hypothetical protein